MSARFLYRWTRQPPGPVRIAGPWRSRVTSAWYANAGVDVVSSNKLKLNGTGLSVSGGKLNCPGGTGATNYADLGTLPRALPTDAISSITIATPAALAVNAALFVTDRSPAGYGIGEGYADSSTICANDAGGNYTDPTATGTFVVGERRVWAHTYLKAPENISFYRDGKLLWPGIWHYAAEPFVTGTKVCPGGSNGTGTMVEWNGTVELNVLFGVALSAPEIAFLSQNPWQLFEPIRRAVFFAPAAAGGTDVNVTPTAISSVVVARGALTASASVSVVLTGVAATAAAGSLSPGIAVSLTGVTTTVAAGTATPSISTALAGKTATVGLGAIASAISTVLAGQVAALARGLLTPGIQFQPVGQATTVAAGTLATTLSSALTGTTVTVAAPATISSSVGGNADATLVGTFASVAAGTLAPSASVSVALTGVATTVGKGTLATTLATALTGTTATVSRGALAPSTSVSAALTGKTASVAVPASIDSEVAGSPTAALTTKLVTVTPGVLTSSASVTVALVGQAVSAGRGAISAVPELSVALIGASVGVARGTLSPGLAALLAGSTIVVTPGLIGVQTEASATFELVGQSVAVGLGNFVLLVPTIQALKYPLFVTTKVDDLVV